MSFESYDRFWMGALSALLGTSVLYLLIGVVMNMDSSGIHLEPMIQDARPVLFSSIILVLFGRWLLVVKKFENAGRGFFLVLIPLVLLSLYFVFQRKNG